MDKNTRCCFAGHRDMYDNKAKDRVKSIAEELITRHNVDEFWIGNYGSFDSCCVSAIRELKKVYPHIEIDLVIPYLTKEINEYKELYYKKYDHILVADIGFNTPKTLHIIKANEYMVKNCQFLICYINHTWGGAAKTYSYAKRKRLQIYNVAPCSIPIF